MQLLLFEVINDERKEYIKIIAHNITKTICMPKISVKRERSPYKFPRCCFEFAFPFTLMKMWLSSSRTVLQPYY